MESLAPVLVAGAWRPADSSSTFHTENPGTRQPLSQHFPVSRWSDVDAALSAAVESFEALLSTEPKEIAAFLETYASNIDGIADELADTAHEETGLPVLPRLKAVELPRTTDQLRQAATEAREGNWHRPTIDRERNIRSWLAPVGPVVIFGPNNFPFAFNGVSGGDFAAAIASGNPIIAKAHPLHPHTSQKLAEQAHKALVQVGLPPAAVQMIYALSNEDGLRMVSDPRVGATAFTGSKAAGLRLKLAAEEAGNLIYLEMSSTNPVILLPGAVQERGSALAKELADSCLMGSGQFCTRPNIVFLFDSPEGKDLVDRVKAHFAERTPQPLLSCGGRQQLHEALSGLVAAGAVALTGMEFANADGYRYSNTLLQVMGEQFLANPGLFQSETFGNALTAVIVQDGDQLSRILQKMEGNLTGCFYTADSSQDEDLYRILEPILRRKVGRLLNNRMPTGVAVSPAMNHGGPYPATGHPGFTAVGIPASLGRFTMLQSFDNVPEHRLPRFLR